MDKVKTLEDIGEGEMNDVDEISPGKYKDLYGVPAVSKKKLRQEAIKCLRLEEIKFVKVLSEAKRIELGKQRLDNPATHDFSFKVTAEVKRFITWFFNITEGDLQCKD